MLSVQSPAAKISGTDVFIKVSTVIPREQAPPISRISAVLARTPTARTTKSNSTFTPLFMTAAFSSKQATESPRRKQMPFSSKCRCTKDALSPSRILDSIRSDKSHTVIFFTFPCSPSAHFKPINPAPIIRTRLSAQSAFSICKASSSVINVNFSFTFSINSSPLFFSIGGTKGSEPAAIHSASYAKASPVSSRTFLPTGSIC